MDYKKFFEEVTDWINEVNKMAIKYGMGGEEFWTWVTTSVGEMCNKYDNNKLVVNQMVMLTEWLEDIYFQSKAKQ